VGGLGLGQQRRGGGGRGLSLALEKLPMKMLQNMKYELVSLMKTFRYKQ
jgi:hypothetical protein